MKTFQPIAALLVGLFALIGVDADEQTMLAVITGLIMAGSAAYSIWENNSKK